MKFATLLLCIAIGIFAFVDAAVVERRSGELRKRAAESSQQCTSNTPAPDNEKPPNAHSRSSHRHANSDTADGNSSAASASATDAKTGGKNKNKEVLSTTTAADTAATSIAATKNKGKGGKNNKDTTTTSAAAAAAASDPPSSVGAASANTDAATATNSGSNGGSNTCLSPGALQTGSEQTGQSGTVEAGQVESQTSDNNFINICDGQTLTNGKQIVTGSCNGIPLGFIPAKQNMPSSIITFPEHNQDIAANTTFQIAVTVSGMQLGSFTNAQLTYYSAPTVLNSNGLIIGHTHVTVQDLGGSFTPSQPLDATRFAFFLGINTPANSNGQVFANVPNGLPPGFYRVCTMVGNSNHSPLQMPVAQRGAQDDCHYFSVGQGSSNTNTASNVVANTVAAADTASSTSSTSSAAAAATKAAGGRGGKKAANVDTVSAADTASSTSSAASAAVSAADTTSSTSSAASAAASATKAAGGRGGKNGAKGGA